MSGQHFDYECGTVLLVDEEGNIVAQLRDNKPTINSPGKASFFGGRMESGETPKQCALREIAEETNLQLNSEDLQPLADYVVTTTLDNKPELQHVFIAKGIATEGLKVYEGQGAHIVRDLNDPLIADAARSGFAKWFAEREQLLQAATLRHSNIHRYAAALLVDVDGRLFGQLRDDIPHIDQPGKIGGFGGVLEDGELPQEGLMRELEEETNLNLADLQIEPFATYIHWRPLGNEYELCNIFVARNVDLEGIEVYEGQGLAEITTLDPSVVAIGLVPALRQWFGAVK